MTYHDALAATSTAKALKLSVAMVRTLAQLDGWRYNGRKLGQSGAKSVQGLARRGLAQRHMHDRGGPRYTISRSGQDAIDKIKAQYRETAKPPSTSKEN